MKRIAKPINNKEKKRWEFIIHYFDQVRAVQMTSRQMTKPMTHSEFDKLLTKEIDKDKNCCFIVVTKGFWRP